MILSDRLPAADEPSNGEVQAVASCAGWRSWWSYLRGAARIAQVRLRFVAVFAVTFLVIGNWESLRNHLDHWTTFSMVEAPGAISNDTEYFCPMCPGVFSDWPAKCPVCNMALVRRKKGGSVQLPEGVVSRMQYSPYRLQLAGVRTSVVDYSPLAREIAAPAFVLADESLADATTDRGMPHLNADVELSQHDAAMLSVEQKADVRCAARPGLGPWRARVRSIDYDSPHNDMSATVRIRIDNPKQELSPGMEISVRFNAPLADIEPFRSQPADPEPLSAHEARQVFVCPDHPDIVKEAAGKCPRDGLELVARPLSVNERLQYWCPMHPHVTARDPGHKCDECGGMVLVPRVVTYRPGGKVLAVPENAVIDRGAKHLVYLDRGEGMFDGVEIEVGPRVAGYYAVVSGLQAGQRVASAGAFLLDAETRLTSNAATAYFGATTNSTSATHAPSAVPQSPP